MVYLPLITPVLRRLNILDIIKAEAYLNWDGVVWRDGVNGEVVGRLRLEDVDGGGEFGGTYQLGRL